MRQPILMFFSFIRKDVHIFYQRLSNNIINYGIIFPALYAVSFGYLLPMVSWGDGYIRRTTIMFSGSITMLLLVLAFMAYIDLIFDFEQDRFIDYQTSILPARLVLLERLLFSSLFCFILLVPFFPLTSLILRGTIDFSNASWLLMFFHLFLCSLFYSALNIFAVCAIKSSLHMEDLWSRVFTPMLMLGGFEVPWVAMSKAFPALKNFFLLNPVIFASEGFRQALVGGSEFLPLWACESALIVSTVFFMVLAMHYFKKKIDHV